ncbi:hypothetical protein OH77DRAFT_1436170 [Trametes cingulata]|nr:hypothetical protein OH77DRAFT_1436170 [Trametes cingulata]
MSTPQRNSAPSTPMLRGQGNRFAVLEDEGMPVLTAQSVPATPPPAYDQIFVPTVPATAPVFGATSFPPLPSTNGAPVANVWAQGRVPYSAAHIERPSQSARAVATRNADLAARRAARNAAISEALRQVQEERNARLRAEMEALAIGAPTPNVVADNLGDRSAATLARGDTEATTGITAALLTTPVALGRPQQEPSEQSSVASRMPATNASVASPATPPAPRPAPPNAASTVPERADSPSSSEMYWTDADYVLPVDEVAADDRMDEDPTNRPATPDAAQATNTGRRSTPPVPPVEQGDTERPRKGKKRARLDSSSPSPAQKSRSPTAELFTSQVLESRRDAPVQEAVQRNRLCVSGWPNESASNLPRIGEAGPSNYNGSLPSRIPPPVVATSAAAQGRRVARRGVLEAETLRYGDRPTRSAVPWPRGSQGEDAMNVDDASAPHGAPPPDLEDLYGDVAEPFRLDNRPSAGLQLTVDSRGHGRTGLDGRGHTTAPPANTGRTGVHTADQRAPEPPREDEAGDADSAARTPPPESLQSVGAVYSAAMTDDLQDELSQQGLPPIPHAFTVPPADGFPRTNFSDPEALRMGISAGRLTTLNEQDEGTYAFVQIYNVAVVRGPQIRFLADALSNALTAITGILEPLIIPPEPDWSAPAARRQAPRTWIVLRLTPESVDRLVERTVWSSVEITFFAYRTEPVIPRYLFSLSGFTHDWDRDVFRTVQRVFNTSTVRASIAELAQANVAYANERLSDVTTAILRSLVVVVNNLNSNMLMAAVYMDSPTTSIQRWRDWRDRLARLPYQTTYNNMGVHRRFAPCEGCHAHDHPTHLCPFLQNIPGWNVPRAGSLHSHALPANAPQQPDLSTYQPQRGGAGFRSHRGQGRGGYRAGGRGSGQGRRERRGPGDRESFAHDAVDRDSFY